MNKHKLKVPAELAKGIITREIVSVFKVMCAANVSPTLISQATDAIRISPLNGKIDRWTLCIPLFTLTASWQKLITMVR